MRLLIFVLLLSLPAMAWADTTVTPQIDTVWRSDAALNDAADLIGKKKYTEAIAVLEQIIQRDVRNTDAHLYSAIAWADIGDTVKAKSFIDNAIAIDRQNLGAYTIAGYIALQENNRGQANTYLSALRTLCRGDTCPEYHALQKAIIDDTTKKAGTKPPGSY